MKKSLAVIAVVVIVAIVATYFLWPRPEIKVSALVVPLEFAKLGEKFNVTVSLRNAGGASGSYLLEFKVDGNVVARKDVILNPGAYIDYVFPISLNTTGVHTLTAGEISKTVRAIKPLFADVRIRKAFTYAFDYQAYIRDVLKAGAIQPNGPVPMGMFGYNASIPIYTYNLTKAKELLQQAATEYGFSPEHPIKITLYYNEGNAAREKACLLLASAIKGLNVGLDVEVISLAWPQYLAKLRAMELPIFFLGWAPDYIDPDDYLVPFLHSEKGTFPIRTGYKNPKVDQLVEMQSSILDPLERQRVISQICEIVYEDVPFLWTAQPEGIHFEREWIQGWYYNPAFPGYYYATISKAPGAANPNALIMESIGEPDYVDPAVDYETAGGEVIMNVYETLFWFNGSDSEHVIPWLAEGYEVSEDGMSYTIYLRKGISFHDGTPFNATAVKYSLERAIIIGDPDGPAWMLDVIRGAGDLLGKIWEGTATQADVDEWRAQNPIEILDDYTIRINLERPYAPFPNVLAYTVCAIVSPSYVEAHGGITIGEHNEWMDRHAEAGTGPYILESWEAGTVILRKNPNYWGGPKGEIHPIVERVIIRDVPDANTRLTDLLAGNADFAYIVRDHWYQLIDQNSWELEKKVVSIKEGVRAIGPLPTFDIDFLGFNYRY
ncbi:MAG: ABC transporter substrate-binding protein [Candidatus Bathyarchaeia archaeon]